MRRLGLIVAVPFLVACTDDEESPNAKLCAQWEKADTEAAAESETYGEAITQVVALLPEEYKHDAALLSLPVRGRARPRQLDGAQAVEAGERLEKFRNGSC